MQYKGHTESYWHRRVELRHDAWRGTYKDDTQRTRIQGGIAHGMESGITSIRLRFVWPVSINDVRYESSAVVWLALYT